MGERKIAAVLRQRHGYHVDILTCHVGTGAERRGTSEVSLNCVTVVNHLYLKKGEKE